LMLQQQSLESQRQMQQLTQMMSAAKKHRHKK
jgi:hypothetical protein